LLKKSASTPIDISTDENSTKQSLPLQIKDPKGKLSVLEKRTGRRTPKGEEYVEFRIDQWKQIQKFYTVSSTLDPKQLLTRSDESKTVTFVTKSITMDLLEEMKKKRVKVVYTGIKMFERNETNTGEKLYRLCQSGSHVLLPHMSSRIIRVSSRDFQILLEKQGKLLSFDLFTPPTQEAFEKSSIGTLVCLLDRTTSCHTG
jgi:intracellular sulfur oxidation DsrE/DsrF family protein